jgi:alpha-galactosidase
MIRQTIDAMVSSGLSAVGYQYVNIDDCWSQRSGRNTTTQQLVPDPKRFPGGIKALADYAHSKNIKLGIYSDVGIKTCAGYPGSYGYYKIDADTFASWNVDYLKFDYCYTFKNITEKPWIFYGEMSDALNKTGRPILFSICNWGESKPHLWAPKIANTW